MNLKFKIFPLKEQRLFECKKKLKQLYKNPLKFSFLCMINSQMSVQKVWTKNV